MQEFVQMCQELRALYERMDQAYGQAAALHGFACAGCEDNCCRTRFYHHTLAEFLYLKKGVAELQPSEQAGILQKAQSAAAAMQAADQRGESVRIMCPLNENERCVAYDHRPMICRLHGIPHRLRRPDGQMQAGPGCGDFDRQCGRSDQVHLDRTALYGALADLEKRLRRRAGFDGKIRMTIAQILTLDPLQGKKTQ